MKENQVLKEALPKGLIPLIEEHSYQSEGQIVGSNHFSVTSRWAYEATMRFIEVQEMMKWVRDNGYSGLYIEYCDAEEGANFIEYGKFQLQVTTDGYEIDKKYKTWMLEEFASQHMSRPFPVEPDDEDFTDEDEYFDALDLYNEIKCDYFGFAQDHLIENMFRNPFVELDQTERDVVIYDVQNAKSTT